MITSAWGLAVEVTLTQAALAALMPGAAAALIAGLGLLLAPARGSRSRRDQITICQ
ncbi:MAG TPA: hypothetical protein VFM97_11005 [Gammaproteobacteria bacterium]|nr:hypothetical protein [Gammaproteobacteria bacterium]